MKETDKSVATEDKFPYKDILYLDPPTSKTHPRQPISARAGQFSPFAALTGYDEQVTETGRETEKRKILDEEEKEKLDTKLQIIKKNMPKVKLKITYFVKDEKKSGGKYLEKCGNIVKIDSYKKMLTFEDKEQILIENIINIEILNKQETE